MTFYEAKRLLRQLGVGEITRLICKDVLTFHRLLAMIKRNARYKLLGLKKEKKEVRIWVKRYC